MAAVRYDISFARGQDQNLAWTMTPTTDITGWTFELTVRKRFDSAVLFTLSIGSGLAVVSAPAGTMTVVFSSAQTKDLDVGRYRYDLWRTNAGNKRRLSYGNLNLLNEVVEL